MRPKPSVPQVLQSVSWALTTDINVIAAHGYDGLILATLMAGLILITAGVLRLGQLVKYVPHPVITGFTAGIAVIIASSQIKDFLGLAIASPPADFVAKWHAYFKALPSVSGATFGVGIAALALIVILRRYSPRLPAFLIAVVLSALAVAVFKLPVDTIGSRYPDMPAGLPIPAFPDISWAKVIAVFPSAFIIAFLAGIEALLSAVVADGMAGTHHRSNQELIGQGIANLGSAMFGGLPATGAIARTATNIRAGAQTPLAGIMHAAFLLLFILFCSRLMAYVPLAALAAILLVVAWGMSEYPRFRALLRMPNSERFVLLLTFGLTVLVDLTVAIGVGVSLASLLFVARMADTVVVDREIEEGDELEQRDGLPPGVEVFRIEGPLFFGVAGDLLETFRRLGKVPRVLILRMGRVPLLDASGAQAIADLARTAAKAGTAIILAEIGTRPLDILARAGLDESSVHCTTDYGGARLLARELATR